MDDGEALLKAIIAQPAEDVPRLAFADWLTDHGQPDRGEFIRVQCELARANAAHLPLNDPCVCDSIRRPEFGDFHYCGACQRRKANIERLTSRERELWDIGTNAGGFLEIPAHWGVPHWKRGFIEEVRTPAADWLAHSDAILAAHPVQAVTLTTMPEWYHADGTVWLCDEVPSGLSLGVRRGRKCLFATTETRGNIDGRTTYIEALLMHEWPTVKTWNLPPETRAIDLAGVRVSEATHRALARAGRRITEAARRRNPR